MSEQSPTWSGATTYTPALRRVRLYEIQRDADGGSSRVMIGYGNFHQWSMDYEEFETGPGNSAAAIVETDDGKVHVFYAGHIEFVNPIGPPSDEANHE